jgi:predicted dehydrogenase
MVPPVNALFRSTQLVSEIVAGVAGAGVFGGHHAQKYARLAGVRLAAIFDIEPERAARLARAHNAVPYTDFDEFLDVVDVATIAAPASTHYHLARRALEARRHVFIEKPIALRLDHADRLIELAREQGLAIQIGHQERFVFESFGLLARATKPRSLWCRRNNPATGRGEDVSVVFDLMIHDLDLVRLLDLGPVVLTAARGNADEIEAEIAFAGGAVATFEATRRASIRDRQMTLVYEDGIIEIDFVKRTISNTTETPLAAAFDGAAASSAFADPLGHGVAQFIAAVRGERAPAVTAEEGRAALEWAIAIDRAAKPARAPMKVRAQA